MNNIEAAITNVDIIIKMLEGHWTMPQSEKERDILAHLRATAIQLNEAQREVSIKLDTVRRAQ